ncbi:MAG: DUF1284 domain-containing protein [Candidatus Pacearchaeota archaeon]
MIDNKNFFVDISGHHLLILICSIGSENPKKYYGIKGNNFEKVLKIIKKNPNINIRIIIGGDFICYPCPKYDKNNKNCNIYPQNISKDKRMLEILKVNENDIRKFSELKKIIKKNINREKYEYIWGKKIEDNVFSDFMKGLDLLY